MPSSLVPAKIDSYLAGRGSPMAGTGASFIRAGKKYGVDPRLLVGMAVIESSAGKALAHPYNPFNWGHHQNKQYGSWEESIMDVARGMRRGYYDKGLKTPAQIVSKYAPASDNNDEGNWASVVSGVMKQLGGAPVPAAPRAVAAGPALFAPSGAPPPDASPFLDPFTLSASIRDQFLQGGGKIDLASLPGTVRSAWQTPVAPPVLPGVPQAAAPDLAASPGAAGGALTGKAKPGPAMNWVGKIEHRTGPSPPHTQAILNFVGRVGQIAGTKLTPWGNESHSLTTVNGNPSAHGTGRAADIPSSGAALTRLGQAALIAAGMPPAQARKIKGGLFNVGGHQVIFNTNEGGNHYDHLHVGLRG